LQADREKERALYFQQLARFLKPAPDSECKAFAALALS
jgi:hypothetical protein